MKKFLPYFRGYGWDCFLAPVFKLLEALMDLAVPLVIAAMINQGLASSDKGFLFRCFLMLMGLMVLGMGFSFTAQYFAARGSVGVVTRLRQALFDHIQGLSYRELDTLGTDTLITRLTSDVTQVQTGLNLALRLLLRSPFIVFGSMVMAFFIDVPSALVFAISIPLLLVVVLGVMGRSIPLFKRVQEALDRLLQTTRENLTGVRVIRAFCQEKTEVEEFDSRNADLTRKNLHVGRWSALMTPGTYLLVNLATVILIRQGALRVEMGAMAQGDVVALYNYMAQMIIELVKLGSMVITLNKSAACASRIQGILEVKSSLTSPAAYGPLQPLSVGPAVAFHHVSFGYAGGAEAVTDLDFAIPKGSTVGIIGGTGSGKTTLVDLIPRFYDVTRGQVEVDGRDVREYPVGHLLEKIALVPQKAVLFEGTIRDNLRWGKADATDEELWQALETAQAKDVVLGKEGQLDALVEQGGRNLSGGQKQRLTIARALVKKPEILILDDSASALDFATDLRLRQAIKALEGEMTVFIVSQRTSSVRQADLILVLDDGKLVGQGTHLQLLETCPVYQEIFDSQYPGRRAEELRQGKEEA
ncbi:ABC transporter ATP-binding protein [Acidaminococcus massiliensis]|uniref:ABC transporter ATP-binding protein n=1 Tax=Acidaminococcus massiliensis TaxID=1852375 RepID=UPI0035223119